MYRSIIVIVCLCLLALLVACGREKPAFSAGTLLEADPDLFWVAVYNLPAGRELYDDYSLWYGQTASVFVQRLSPNEKKRIMQRLDNMFNERNGDFRQAYGIRFMRWTSIYHQLDSLSSRTSLEEFLAAAYDTGDYVMIFKPAFHARNIKPVERRSIDLISMLSGAGIISVFQDIVTNLSALPPKVAQNRVQSIAVMLEGQNSK